jgi:hypothetical protein
MMVLKEKGYPVLWFVKEALFSKFPFEEALVTSDMAIVKSFQSDAIFVPGNEVPDYLRGLKVQVFHGLAGEKKGHFRIRHYFDLYLTQGPYFTRKFLELKNKFRNFEVMETGWPKLDIYGRDFEKYDSEKHALLNNHTAKHIVLYAPTFSPSMTSAYYLIEEFKELAKNGQYLILIKFHDLMASEMIDAYKQLSIKHDNIVYEEERNIVKFLLMADCMISDTSSVVYEFLLLDKPVITFKSKSKSIRWQNAMQYEGLKTLVETNLKVDPFKSERKKIGEEYHPYTDGKSALRMVEATERFIEEHGVPERRKLSYFRRRKIRKIFGKY